MTYEEKKRVVEAAKVLEEFCEEKRYTDECNKEDCLFHSEMFFKNCKICGTPSTWNVPTLTRWTTEDVALAKALKGFGVKAVFRYFDNVYWRLNEGVTYPLPSGAFKDLRADDRDVSLNTIIEEAAEG